MRIMQGGVAPIASVLPSATAVKIKVNGQLEIFFIVNSQATTLIYGGKVGQGQAKLQRLNVQSRNNCNAIIKIFRSKF